MNLTAARIDEILRGTKYEGRGMDSGFPPVPNEAWMNLNNDASANAAKVILLEGVVRDLVSFAQKCSSTASGKGYYRDENPQYDGAPDANDIIDLIGGDADAALRQAKQMMGEE